MDLRVLSLYNDTVFMAENPYRGEVFIHLGPKARLPLVYNWDAIARLRERWPKQDFDLYNVHDLAEIIAIGLIHHDPQWTDDRVMRASPPLQPAVEAVNLAMHRALYGASKAPDLDPRKPGAMKTLWRKLSGLVPQWGSRRATSGA